MPFRNETNCTCINRSFFMQTKLPALCALRKRGNAIFRAFLCTLPFSPTLAFLQVFPSFAVFAENKTRRASDLHRDSQTRITFLPSAIKRARHVDIQLNIFQSRGKMLRNLDQGHFCPRFSLPTKVGNFLTSSCILTSVLRALFSMFHFSPHRENYTFTDVYSEEKNKRVSRNEGPLKGILKNALKNMKMQDNSKTY